MARVIDLTDEIKSASPFFVCVAADCDFEVELERQLPQSGQ